MNPSELRKPIAWRSLEVGNAIYLHACPPPSDPTITWGTEVDMGAVRSFLEERNRAGQVILSTAHVLMGAVGRTLAAHPDFNARVMDGMVRRYKSVNGILAAQARDRGRADVLVIEDLDSKSLDDIGQEVWDWLMGDNRISSGASKPFRESSLWYQRQWARINRWITRLWLRIVNRRDVRLRGPASRLLYSSVLVNYFAARDLPDLDYFKASRFPLESVSMNITMGGTVEKPVVVDGKVVVRELAPIYVRGDHRIADGYRLGLFVKTLRNFLENPESIEGAARQQEAAESVPAGI